MAPAMGAVTADSLPDDRLDREAGETIRRVALALLDQARAARRALAAGDDPEALHDLRVALRRLRSHLRAYRADLGNAVTRGQLRRIRDLARRTNAARDAEVALVAMRELVPEASRSQRRGLAYLENRLREILGRADVRAADDLLPEFDRLERRLSQRLGRYRVDLRVEAPADAAPLFRERLREVLAEHRAAFEAALGSLRGGDADALHAARIAAKRLRYLIDPASRSLPAADAAIDALKSLQDLLGELNDLRQLVELTAEAAVELERQAIVALSAGEARPRRPSERGGLRLLAVQVAPRRDQLLRALRRQWLTPRARSRGELLAALDRLDAELRAPTRP